MRQDTSGLRGDIVVNGVRYPLDELKGKKVWKEGDALNLQEGDAGIPVSAEWPVGVPGGMGETKRTSRDSIGCALATLDTSNYGFWRLPPRRVTVTPTIPPTDDNTFGFEDAAQGSLATAITQTALTSGSSTSAATAIVSRLLTQGSAGAAGGPAVVGTSLTTLNSATVAASYATASITPTANNLVLATVVNHTGLTSTPTTPTITTAGGLTWVQVSTTTLPYRSFISPQGWMRLTVFRAQAASPSASAVTVDFNSVNQQYCQVSVSEFANTIVDTANNGEAAVGTVSTNSGAPVSVASIDIGSYTDQNNRAYAAILAQTESNVTVSEWKDLTDIGTELADLEIATNDQDLGVIYVSGLTGGGSPTSVIRRQAMTSATTSVSVRFAAIGFEIKADSSAGQLAFVTESITPTGNSLVLAAVHNTKGSAAAPSGITGNGLTWVKINEQAFNSSGDIVSVWRALVASPTAGAATITFAATQTAVRWSIVEFQGVLTTGANGADAIVQSAIATGSSSSPAATLSAFGDAANATYGAFATNATTGITPGTGFTELHEEINTGCLFTEWRSDNDTSVDATPTQSVAWGVVAVEIAASVGAGYQTASITPSANRLILAAVFNNSAGAGTPTLSGCNLTWTQEETVTTSTYRVTVFRALGANPQAGVLTIDFAGTAQTAVRWAVSEFGGVNTTTPVVQSQTNTATGATTLTVTMSAFGSTANATYGVFGAVATDGVSPGSGFTEIHEVIASSAEIETEWKASNDTSVDASIVSPTSNISYDHGSYVGDGTTGRQITVTFQPKVVVVKADHATNGNAMIRTEDMSTSTNVTTAATSNAGISALNASGFTVDHVAESNGRTNEVGKTYYWYALGGSSVKAGSYTGNGTTQSVTGTGTPVMVWVIPSANRMRLRTSDMSTYALDFGVGTSETDTITSLDADGFGVGNDTDVNSSGTTYYYVAFNADVSLAVGTYPGDSNDDRELPASPMSLDPAIVGIKGNAGQEAVFKTASLTGDASLQFGSVAQVANRIQSLTPAAGQFQVGTDAEVNNSAITAYYFFAFGLSGGTTWLGIGIEIAAGTTTVASTGNRFAYLLQGQYASKFSVSSNTITVEAQKDFGDSAVCGKPAKFGTDTYAARWFIPTGPSNPFWRQDLIASSGADTWTQDAANNFALAFAVTNQGTNTVLVRAHSRYLLDLSSDGTSWNADDFEVGDVSTAITSLEDSGVTLFVAKEDNLYDYDSGTCRQLTRYQKGDKDSTYGAGLMAPSGSAACFYPHKALHLYDGDRARMTGLDASPVNKSIPNISYEPHRGAHMELLYASDDWLYATYKVTESSITKTYIIAYQRSGQQWIPHGFDRFDGVAHIFLVDSQKRLWFTDIANALVGYYILGADGSPDAGRDSIGYGTASTTYSLVYPREDFGFPHTLKQLRAVEVKAWNTGDTVPIQVRVYRDGSTAENVGATITSGVVNKRFWNSADSGTTLATALTQIATSVVYTGSDVFSVNDVAVIDDERMLVTAIDTGTNTLTVTRGYFGTAAVEHNVVGTAIYREFDTCYDAQFEISITTTSGYTNTVSDGSELRGLNFRGHAFLRPDSARRVTFVVDTSRDYEHGTPGARKPIHDPKTMRDFLKDLENGHPVAAIDPDGNTLNLFVEKVEDAEPQAVNPANYKLIVRGITWISS